MKKILVFLLIAGLLVSACSIQVAAESTYGEDVSFLEEGPAEYSPGDPAPCGGEGDGGGGLPG
jgi:hypothetical protein